MQAAERQAKEVLKSKVAMLEEEYQQTYPQSDREIVDIHPEVVDIL